MFLEQKRGSATKTFRLEGKELFVKEKNILSSKEWSIHLEEIGYRKEVKIHSRTGVNFIGYAFIVFAVSACLGLFIEGNPEGKFDNLIWGSFFFFIFGIVCLKAPMQNDLSLIGETKIIQFYLFSPSRKEVEEFADELVNRSKKLIVSKYSKIDIDIQEEVFIARLKWLLENDFINEIEYNEKKEAYKTMKLLE